MEITDNLSLFQELIRCGNEVSSWCYDAEGSLLFSNCPDETIFAAAFSLLGCREQMLASAQQNDRPVLLGTAIGLIWGAAFEWKDGRLYRCHLIGPVLYTDISVKAAEQGFAYYDNLMLSVAWKNRFLRALRIVPTVPYIVFTRYLLMLHCCLTGARLNTCDLNRRTFAFPQTEANPNGNRDQYRVYTTEQVMLQMVRNGDLNYTAALSDSALISNGVPLQSRDPLRQGKTNIVVFCTLVCRAAIEGGLSPEESYELGNLYMQAGEDAKTYDELDAISRTMYDDFVRRVHQRRTNPKYSKPIQQCIDYIEMHLGERIFASDLAKKIGYSEYYLTQKFREETQMFINDYIKFAKIERAKLLLKRDDLSTQKIAEQLGFATRSYFSQCFKQVTGCSPSQYRTQQGHER